MILTDACSDGDFIGDYGLIRALFISRVYGYLFLRRRSSVRGIYQWGSVYFRIPWADSDDYGYLFRDCQMMMMMYLSSVYFGTRGSELGLYIPQMVMISSEPRFSTNDQMAWRMATHCIHSSASLHFALIASNTCLPICRDILDRDPG